MADRTQGVMCHCFSNALFNGSHTHAHLQQHTIACTQGLATAPMQGAASRQCAGRRACFLVQRDASGSSTHTHTEQGTHTRGFANTCKPVSRRRPQARGWCCCCRTPARGLLQSRSGAGRSGPWQQREHAGNSRVLPSLHCPGPAPYGTEWNRGIHTPVSFHTTTTAAAVLRVVHLHTAPRHQPCPTHR